MKSLAERAPHRKGRATLSAEGSKPGFTKPLRVELVQIVEFSFSSPYNIDRATQLATNGMSHASLEQRPIACQLDLPVLSRRPDLAPQPTRERRTFRTAGLFAGIGGLEVGMEKAGHLCEFLCEVDEGALEVLQQRFPAVPPESLHKDVTLLEGLPKGIDLLTAGFPCQDLSQAGGTRGIRGAKSGLVDHVFRLLEQHRTPWVVLENVPFMLQLAKGEALRYVVGRLEALGYQWAYRVVDARAWGLPQRRQRVILVASLVEDPRSILFAEDAGTLPPEPEERPACGFYWTEGLRGLGWAVDAVPTLKVGSTIGVPAPPAIWLTDGRFVTPHIRDAERMQGFPADWTKPAEKATRPSHRWKLVGNAVSVPVARWVGDQLACPRTLDIADLPRVRPHIACGSWPKAAWNVGDGVFATDVSPWPVSRKPMPLEPFLEFEPKELSVRAASGFLSRARRSTLRFPPGFLEAIETHISRLSSE